MNTSTQLLLPGRPRRVLLRAAVVTLLLSLATGLRAAEVGKLLEQTPAEGQEQKEALTAAFDTLSVEQIVELTLMLKEPGTEDDTPARLALHGLAMHVGLQGREAQRARMVEALSRQIGADLPGSIKVFMIRQMQLAAGPEAPGVLSGLLVDPEMCKPAAMALMAVGGEGAAEAFRKALPGAPDACLASVLRGVQATEDAKALPLVRERCARLDGEFLVCALEALADLGTPDDVDRLLTAADAAQGRDADRLTEGCLRLARRLTDAGENAAATRVCRHLLTTRTEQPHVTCAALQALTAAAGAGAFEDLLAAMSSEDLQIRNVASRTAVTTPGADITRRWVAHMATAEPGVRAETLAMLGRRGDPVAFPAAVEALSDADGKVRLAAIEAAARLGGPEAVPHLVQVLGGESSGEKKAAADALRVLGDEEVAAALAAAAEAADTPDRVRVGLIEVLGQRKARAHTPVVLRALKHGDEGVRAAAVKALAWLADSSALPTVLSFLAAAASDSERSGAEGTVVSLCRGIQPEADRPAPVVALLARAESTAVRCSCLRILGRLGGAAALGALRSSLRSDDVDVRDVAVRSLAEWLSAEAVGDLLGIVQTTDSEVHRVLALRGYVRLLGEDSTRSTDDALAMFGKALEAVHRPDEKKLVLAGLARLPAPKTLAMVRPYLADEALRAEAAVTMVKIAETINGAYPGEALKAVEAVLEAHPDEALAKKANELKQLIEKYADYITAWEVSGPYAKTGKNGQACFDIEFPPETADAKGVKWQIQPAGTDRGRPWYVDIIRSVGQDNCAAYLRTNIRSPEEQDVLLELGSDDGLKVWLNGEVIHEANVLRSGAAGEDKVETRLKQGWNALMLKVTNNGGGMGANARVRARDGKRLEGLSVALEPGE